MKQTNATRLLVDKALNSTSGVAAILTAETYLTGHLDRNVFNSTRALEVYTIAIDNVM